MSTFSRDVEDSRGDLVGVFYFCSRGCWQDSFDPERIGPDAATYGGESPCSVPEFSDGIYYHCAECGVRLNGPDTPIVVNLIVRPDISPYTGQAEPVRDADQLCQLAREEGEEHGRNAASWYFDGNTETETYRQVLQGIEDGDPDVLDTFPSSPLSGEWADAPTPASVLDSLDVDPEEDFADDILQAYEDGFHEAVEDEINATAREHVQASAGPIPQSNDSHPDNDTGDEGERFEI